MSEVKITYETLFDLLRREKDREELQKLDVSFYADVLSYIEQKKSFIKHDAAMYGADKTAIQIQNVKKIIKELYERRLNKLLRLAVNRSKVGGGLTNTMSMLPEEKEFFENALEMLKKNRTNILNKILFFENNGQAPAKQEVPEFAPEPVKQEEKPNDEYDIKVTVKFTSQVPKFVGKKLETYGPYEDGDTDELPRIIADILVKKGKAEQLTKSND